MRFFDRDFVSARLGDLEWEARIRDYQRHKELLWPHLPEGVRRAVETVPFHDSRIEQLLVHPGGEVQLILFCDTSAGRSRVSLHFEGAALTPPPDELRALVLDERATLIETEVDLAGDGRSVLRFIFTPEGEIGIEFNALSLQREELPTPAERRAPIFQSIK